MWDEFTSIPDGPGGSGATGAPFVLANPCAPYSPDMSKARSICDSLS